MSVESVPPAIQQPGRLDNIQALRGIAACLVVLYHIALTLREGLWPGVAGFPTGLWDRGWVGVDLFFVISGFIMVWTTREIAPGLGEMVKFLWRRALRVYPLWWICAAVMAVYFLIAYGMPAAPDRVAGPQDAWSFALKSLALWPQSAPPLLGVGWTLIHEMWFYIVFAGLILLPRRALLPALLVWAVATVCLYVIMQPKEATSPVLAVMFNPLTLEFIAGALAAWFLPRIPKPSAFTARVICLAAALCVGLGMFLDARVPGLHQHASRTIIYVVPLTAIVWASSAWQPRVPRVLRALGDMSYSLYLTHFLVLIVASRIIRMIAPDPGPVVLTQAALGVGLIVISLGVAWATYQGFERPVTRWLRRKRAH
jgi:peptidoglycan/LPS O-acetylase OafA/YrhL